MNETLTRVPFLCGNRFTTNLRKNVEGASYSNLSDKFAYFLPQKNKKVTMVTPVDSSLKIVYESLTLSFN